MTEREVKLLWFYMQANWPQFDVPEAEDQREIWVRAWLDHLGDLPADLVRNAITSLGQRDHPPKPGQLRTAACELQNRLDGESPVPDVDEAWAEVMATIRRVGRLTSDPTFSHHAIAATVRSIGWLEICSSSEQGVIRGQFFRLYEVCKQRTQREAIPPAPALAPFLNGGVFKRVDDVLAIGPGGES